MREHDRRPEIAVSTLPFVVCRLPFAAYLLCVLRILLKLSMCFSSQCIGFHGCALVDVHSS